MAAELQAEIAGVTTVPSKNTLSDVPDVGFGYRVSKAQKQVPGGAREARP